MAAELALERHRLTAFRAWIGLSFGTPPLWLGVHHMVPVLEQGGVFLTVLQD
jgi:hypothetical protein